MTLDRLLAALDLPQECRVERRVAKKFLVENAAAVTADKRLINDSVDELFWVAALKPSTIAVPEYRDELREYIEIAVLSVSLHPKARTGRLLELVHRAVPYPVVLLSVQGKTPGLSLAHKRRSQGEATKTVIDGELMKLEWDSARDGQYEAGFLNALALPRQLRTSLYALYQGWIDAVVALEAARRTGTFEKSESVDGAQARRTALRECSRLEAEVAKLRAVARKEKQVPRRVELNLKLKRAEAELEAARSRL